MTDWDGKSVSAWFVLRDSASTTDVHPEHLSESSRNVEPNVQRHDCTVDATSLGSGERPAGMVPNDGRNDSIPFQASSLPGGNLMKYSGFKLIRRGACQELYLRWRARLGKGT